MTRNEVLALAAVAGAVAGWWSAKGEKSQAVRAADVLIVGPLLVVSSYIDLEPSVRLALAFIGGATVGYNARNFIQTEASK